ncbi:MAG: hypothetical protein J6386_24200 [Candidatus Synoicihabitans palmerolidicus]|nr:hypothetical protein [Candidatus Synoicihabitans palmerolidicus]MCC5025688.1 hypothetical protein [Candidatus Synoicihabitans palmerolidicus]
MYGEARDHPVVPLYLLTHRIPVIHLVRENQLDAIISWEIVQPGTIPWHVQQDTNAPSE